MELTALPQAGPPSWILGGEGKDGRERSEREARERNGQHGLTN